MKKTKNNTQSENESFSIKNIINKPSEDIYSMSSKPEMAHELNAFYIYCGYDITKNQIIELTEIFLIAKKDLSIQELRDFLTACKLGKYGMIYRSPLSLMVAFNQINRPKFVF